MGDHDEQVHLFELPEEIIEIITSYLDLVDLKNLSQCCQYFNEVCGKRLGKQFKINFSKVLNHRDLNTFKNSKRKYENVGVQFKLEKLGDILKQIQSLPSIVMKYIHILDRETFTGIVELEEIVEQIKRNAPTIKEISTSIGICVKNVEDWKHFIPRSQNISDQYKLSLELEILSQSNNPLNFCQINKDFNYPTKVVLSVKRIAVDHMIANIKEITFNFLEATKDELKLFTKLEKLSIDEGMSLELIRYLITSNKETLRHLRLNLFEIYTNDETFEIPCQLKTFEYRGKLSSTPTTFLMSQSYLRTVNLGYVELTNDLLDILSKQKMLSKLSLDHCSFADSLDLEKFEFIKNVLEIEVYNFSNDGLIVKLILQYADKVDTLSLKNYSCSMVNELDGNNPKKVLSNLKHLEIFGVPEFVISRIEAPNLEKCCIDCSLDLLYDCKGINNLTIREKLNPKDIQSILKNLPHLEEFYLTINNENLEETLQFILKNINNGLHFRLFCFESVLDEQISEYKNMTSKTLDYFNISYLESTSAGNYDVKGSHFVYLVYNTDSFSFEISVYVKKEDTTPLWDYSDHPVENSYLQYI